jgi:hypothetical protein
MTERSSALTAPSTMDWRQWWEVEARTNRTDWKSLLRQHQDVFRRLCEHAGVSS